MQQLPPGFVLDQPPQGQITPLGQPDPSLTQERQFDAAAEARAQAEERRRQAEFGRDQQEFQTEQTETQEQRAAAAAARRQQLSTGENIVRVATQAEQQVSPATVGLFGVLMGNIPGTASSDFRESVKPIQAALAFDRLQAMREASPTGGALGAVSERELDLLGGAVASLSQAQSPEQYRESLNTVRTHYINWLNTLRQAQGEAPIPYGAPTLSRDLGNVGARSGGRQVVTREGGNDAAQRAWQQIYGAMQNGASLDDLVRLADQTGVVSIDPNHPEWQAYGQAVQREDYDYRAFRPALIGDTEQNYEEANIDPITGAAIGAGQVATFNQLDELLPGSTEDNRAIFDEAARQQPAATIGGMAGGALALPLGAPKTIGGLAVQGAGLGVAYGYGGAEGNIIDRLPEAAAGAGIGAATGYGVGKIVPPIISNTQRMISGGVERLDNSAVGRFVPGQAGRVSGRADANRQQEISQAAAQAAGTEGVRVPRVDVDDSALRRFTAAESGQDGARLRQGLDETVGDVQSRMREIAPGARLDDNALGERVQQGVERYIDRSRGVAGRLYERAENASQRVNVTPARALDEIDDELLTLRQAPNSNRDQINFLQSIRDDIEGGGSVRVFRDLRTNLRDRLKQNNLTATQSEARVMRIMDRLGEDIQEAVSQQAPQGAMRLWQRADNFYRQRQSVINDTLRRVVGPPSGPGSFSAEQVAKRVVSMSRNDSGRLAGTMSRLNEDERAAVAATIMDGLGRDRKGEFSFPIFLNSLERINEGNSTNLRLLFGREGAESLRRLADIATARGRTESFVNRSRTNTASQNKVNAFIDGVYGGTAVGATTGSLSAGAGAAAVMSAAGKKLRDFVDGRAARREVDFLLDREFANLLRSAPRNPTERAANAFAARVNRYIAANDNAAVAFSRAAADESEE